MPETSDRGRQPMPSRKLPAGSDNPTPPAEQLIAAGFSELATGDTIREECGLIGAMRAAAAGDLDVGRIQRGAGVHGVLGVVLDRRNLRIHDRRSRRGVQRAAGLHGASLRLASGWTRGARENLPPGISRKSRVKLP